MDRGIDTTFIVQAELIEHAGHLAARAALDRMLDAGDRLAIAPQVLAEFVHIATDPKRFSTPLDVPTAVERADAWWSAEEVRQVTPHDGTVRLFVTWMQRHRLGRKRILDTLLAATYYTNGVTSVVSTNARDFAVFDCFDVLIPGP